MKRQIHSNQGITFAFLCLLYLTCVSNSIGAGVTIITHGLSGDIDDWVIAIARSIPNYFRYLGTNFQCYEISVTNNGGITTSVTKLEGGAPSNNVSGEIVIKLDWRSLANNSYSTYQVAAAVVPRLLQTNLIAELRGHALAELPIHLIGHSRGGSLVCEISKQLGTNGVWVDHLTTLDPHPLNNDVFDDRPFYTIVDAPARTYENVVFHDNYYQELNFIAYGEPVFGAYVRELTNLDGGYDTLTASHSDVHLWYHGTVDVNVPTDDSVASITSTERGTWWTPNEYYGLYAGFYYSLIGGGDRLSTNRPAGTSTARIRDGYNQWWDFGAGVSNNRTELPANNGNWPNIVKFNFTSTNVFAQGQTNTATFYYQWGRPGTSNAIVSIYLDDDFNPYNGNEKLVKQGTVPGSGANQVPGLIATITINATNSTPGYHVLYAKITAEGRTRYLYAPEILTVFSSLQPPRLAIAGGLGLQPRIDLFGVTGQRVVLQSSTDLEAWQSRATNWLDTNVWRYFDLQSGSNYRFYRAILQ